MSNCSGIDCNHSSHKKQNMVPQGKAPFELQIQEQEPYEPPKPGGTAKFSPAQTEYVLDQAFAKMPPEEIEKISKHVKLLKHKTQMLKSKTALERKRKAKKASRKRNRR